ncbi:hypothetical protein DE146DRAFT_50181 [Phaeosphaeria sp. MPI-PUGE-AT-0046c]|nr:hypothetical protein DE146DRAFT_50181 [Phaeosphaeria sp. MPI-PUGE-AT-0046c]
MLAASRNSYTRLLNWEQFSTFNGEIHIPFARYVKRNTTHVVNTTFWPFLRLPRELQLQIIQFCNGATLFQLMHTSCRTRSDAQQLFWSRSDIWYHIDGEWLLAGGLTGYTHYAVNFLCNVQRVEIQFHNMNSFFDDWIDGERRLVVYDQAQPIRTVDEQIEDLWRLLATLCPRVKHVVVSESCERQALHKVHKALVERCPAPLSVTASYLQGTRSNPSTVQRLRVKKPFPYHGNTDNWPILDIAWTRQTILLPLKEFRGPGGIFQRTEYALTVFIYQIRSLDLLRIEAIEKYHFGTECRAFSCPEPTCPARFTLPGQWPAHVGEFPSHLSQAKLPSEFAIPLADHEKELRRIYQRDRWETIENLRVQWGIEGSEQARAIERAFLTQLEQDPLYTCSIPAKETALWKNYQMCMKYGEAYPG